MKIFIRCSFIFYCHEIFLVHCTSLISTLVTTLIFTLYFKITVRNRILVITVYADFTEMPSVDFARPSRKIPTWYVRTFIHSVCTSINKFHFFQVVGNFNAGKEGLLIDNFYSIFKIFIFVML